jgi:hypothetical protein
VTQLDHPASVVGVFGSQGSGKTTWTAAYIANHRAKLRFLYDPEHEFSARFKLRPARTPRGLDEALATGWVCYQPEVMFPNDDPAGLEFFAAWALAVCERVPGTKLFVFDEAQRYLSPNVTPPNLRTVVNRGRRRGLDVVFISRSPMECGPKMRREITEVVTFHFTEPGDLEWLSAYGFDPDRIAALPLHARIVRDRFGREKFEGASSTSGAAGRAGASTAPTPRPRPPSIGHPAPPSTAPEA